MSAGIIFLFLFVFLSGFLIYSRWNVRFTPPIRDIAITIDDVPIERSRFEKILHHLRTHNAPVTVFVIANRLNADEFAYLNGLKGPDFMIGNHSYSHQNLRRTPTAQYITDLKCAEGILEPLLSSIKYFRYPYLSMGKWLKKIKVKKYLAENNYVIAPVTIRSRDVGLNRELMSHPHTETFLQKIKQNYLDLVWQRTIKCEKKRRYLNNKHILLIHANALNEYFLGDLLNMYSEKGYRFISLDDVLMK